MTPIDREEQWRREQAVKTIRGFVPWYIAVTVLMFLPALSRLGLPGPPEMLRPWWGVICLTSLMAMAGALVFRLGNLGQYQFGKGLRFDFFLALNGVYRPLDPADRVPAAPASPLQILRTDVDELHPALSAAGAGVLAETVRGAMAEAESVARLLNRDEAEVPGLPLPEARAAIGGFSDRVQALRAAVRRGEVPGVEAVVRFEEDLRALRSVGDALRRGPAPAETGTG